MGKALGKGGAKTVQTESSPWGAQQPYLQELFGQAQSLYGKGPMKYFPGQTVADQSPYTQQGIESLAGSANDPNSLTNQGAGEFGKTVRGDYLNADSNPYLKGAVDKALGDVQSRVSSTFGRGGGNNYGSSAHQEWLGKSLAETALPIYAQNYQTERGRQLNAAQLAPGMEASANAPLLQAGGMQDAYKQSLINAEKSKFDFEQQSPWDALQRYQGAIGGNYGGTQQQPYHGSNPLADALGLGLGGMGLYRMAGGGPLIGGGAAAGGSAGGAGGAMQMLGGGTALAGLPMGAAMYQSPLNMNYYTNPLNFGSFG